MLKCALPKYTWSTLWKMRPSILKFVWTTIDPTQILKETQVLIKQNVHLSYLALLNFHAVFHRFRFRRCSWKHSRILQSLVFLTNYTAFLKARVPDGSVESAGVLKKASTYFKFVPQCQFLMEKSGLSLDWTNFKFFHAYIDVCKKKTYYSGLEFLGYRREIVCAAIMFKNKIKAKIALCQEENVKRSYPNWNGIIILLN